MKTLVLGLGNPILCDDRIGLRVIEELEGLHFDLNIILHKTTLAGFNLLENLSGFDRAIIVDAIQTGAKPGKIYRLTPQDVIAQHAFPHLHNLDFFRALILGQELVWDIPKDVMIVAIEAEDVSTFGEDLTLEVEKAIPKAVEHILAILNEGREESRRIEIPQHSCP